MRSERLIDSLERFADVFTATLRGVVDDDARWRPEGGGWSILEIASHLADEEVEDFRPRLERTLADPDQDWDPIDPEGVAVARRYNENDLAEVVARFVRERRDSIARLRALAAPDFDRAKNHPLGTLRAGDLLASWAAHDTLHLRQIAKRLFQLVERDAAPYSTRYAGEWTA